MPEFLYSQSIPTLCIDGALPGLKVRQPAGRITAGGARAAVLLLILAPSCPDDSERLKTLQVPLNAASPPHMHAVYPGQAGLCLSIKYICVYLIIRHDHLTHEVALYFPTCAVVL